MVGREDPYQQKNRGESRDSKSPYQSGKPTWREPKQDVINHCTSCNKDGHTRDRCFELIGYPVWWPGNRKQKEIKPKSFLVETNPSPSEGLTNKQYEMFVKHFERNKGSNMEEMKPTSHLTSNRDDDGDWVVDSGSTDHITYNIGILENRTRNQYECPVVIPNGNAIPVEGRGECTLSGETKIENVLHIPKFTCNLLSVSRLCNDLQSAITFFPDFCVMQKLYTRKLIGTGECRRGLYRMRLVDNKRKAMMTSGDIWHKRLGHASADKLAQIDFLVKLLDWGEDGMATAAEAFTLRAFFQQEVAVWHKLDHPNVTKFLGASMGTTDSLASRMCCILVENLQGGTLKKYLIKNSRKKLSFKNVIQLALDLSRGLSYLHSKKIVHRDVKTENMLLDKNGMLKIADFGVARVEAQNPLDMTGVTGTIGYMAPEVIDGKPYDRKCDVYSLAICLWEIYCCDMPYCDMPYCDLTFADLCEAVVHKNLRPSIPKCCPRAFANILKKCWDAKPKKRPEMAEVVKMLEEIDTSKGGGMLPEDQITGCFCVKPPRGP